MDWIALYHDLAERIVMLTGGSDKLAHVHAGLILYFGTQIVLRERRSSGTALKVVILLECANEAMDRLFWGEWRWWDTGADAAATLFWPAASYCVGRYRRARWEAAQRLAARAGESMPRAYSPA